MGMLDSELVFSAAQSTAAFAVGDNPSTNTYDTASAYNNAQSSEASQTGENLWVRIGVNTVFAGAGATVQGVLQTSPDNTTWTDSVAGGAQLATGLLAGQYLLEVQPPSGTQRYWRTIVRVAVAALTAGAVDAYISNTIQHNIQRPTSFVVA